MSSVLVHENQQRIKYFISVSDELIPDIVNESVDIFSHFRFYFNDPNLAMFDISTQESLIHQIGFENNINQIYDQWLQTIGAGNLNLSDKKYENFIAFIEFWVRNSKNIQINYEPFDELVQESVQDFIDNQISLLSHQSLKQQFNKKLESQINSKSRVQLKAKRAITKLSSNDSMLKRLQNLFHFFAKKSKNTHKNPTFDEIHESFVTLDLGQWVGLIRKVCIPQRNENKAQQIKATVREIKQAFDKNCTNHKTMNFEQFQKGLKYFFRKKLKVESDEEAMRLGMQTCEVDSENKFKQKMRKLGAFVSDEITFIQKPEIVVKQKKVKPKYLIQKSTSNNKAIPSLSEQKKSTIQNVKHNSHIEIKKQDHSPKITLMQLRGAALGFDNLKETLEMEEQDYFLRQYMTKSPSENFLKRLDHRISAINSKLGVRF